MNTMYRINDNLILSSKQYVLKVRDLPQELQPRERMVANGPGVLSMAELLSVVLGSGTVKEGVLEMTARIIREYGERTLVSEMNPAKLATDLAIPLYRACQIVACGEIGRRLYQKSESGFKTIRSAKDVYEYVQDMRFLPKEHLRGLYLNIHHRIIHDEIISIGTVDTNIVHPREVFRPAIEHNAVAVVLVHNHPSNVPTPSHQDILVTTQLIEAGKMMGIAVLDHVIVTKDEFISINAHY